MKSILVYGWEISVAAREYGELDEFKAALAQLKEKGIAIVRDNASRLTYIGLVVADVEANEVAYFDLDNVMGCVKGTERMTAAADEALGHWWWRRTDAAFHLMILED